MSEVVVRIRYPKILRDRASKVATAFQDPKVKVELVEDSVDEIIIEGPVFATADLTKATALLRRYLLAVKKRESR